MSKFHMQSNQRYFKYKQWEYNPKNVDKSSQISKHQIETLNLDFFKVSCY